MVYHSLPLLVCCCMSLGLSGQIAFTKQTDLLTPKKHFSSVAIAVLDMNGDGRDDIARMDQGFRLAIEYQTGPGKAFRHQSIEELPDGAQWGICAGDLDNNGVPDILAAGYYDGIKIAMANADGSAYTVHNFESPETFGQGVNFADINGDNWLDAFICHDDGASRIFLNDSSGGLVYSPSAIDLSTWPASDDSGNYGSVWSDVNNDGHTDLYISKCRSGINDPKDGRRINQLFLNNGDGTYSQDTANLAGLRIGAQSWTADFGDIDNDGDFDCFVTNHDISSQLLENDGSGHFTDISGASGMYNAITSLPVQAVFRDFDNDGYVDILVAGTAHHLFLNNGNKTFTRVPILDDTYMESFALGDLNADGFQDIYAGYAEVYADPSVIPDALWFNEGNNNHYFGLNLRGIQSNRSAIGAKVFLYSSLGTQVREVRSGESYGIMNSMQLHFGMGQITWIDSVVIHWPSGFKEILIAPVVDQYLTVEEGKCVIPPVLVEVYGNPIFCSGDSVQIVAPAGFVTYSWNTGNTGTQIIAKDAGQYALTVTTTEGCTAVSNSTSVLVNPVEIPTIAVLGDTVFCIGGSVQLSSSPAAGYLWNTGDTSATITVEQSGAYSVVVQGLCAQFSSKAQQVKVLETQLPAPVADTVALNSRATLTASGDEPLWYDAATGGNLLFTGSSFETPPLVMSTSYWVANNTIYDSPNVFSGMINHMGSNFAGLQTNGAIIFDCITPFRLAKVKVFTNLAGLRKIDLRDTDGEVLQSVVVNIPSGITTITLNLDIPVGDQLQLTTDPDFNQQNLGSIGPQLRRSDLGVSHPYEVPGYLSIKSSNYGSDRYYYFYNWEIDLPEVKCLSDRVPVTAVVDSTLVGSFEQEISKIISLYPNPTTGQIQLEWEQFTGGELQLALYTATGVLVHSERRNLPAGPLWLPLQFGHLPAGAYWLQLKTADQTARHKVLID